MQITSVRNLMSKKKKFKQNKQIISNAQSSNPWFDSILNWISDHSSDLKPTRLTYLGLIYAFLFFYPWLRLKFVSFPLTYQYFYLIYFAAAFFLFTCVMILARKFSLPRNIVFYLISALLLVKLISGATGLLPYKMWFGSYGIWSDSVFYWLSLTMLFFSLLALKPTKKENIVLIQLLIFQALILGLKTWKDSLAQGAFEYIARPTSPLFNPNYQIAYTLLFLPVALILAIRDAIKLKLQWIWSNILTWLKFLYFTFVFVIFTFTIIFCLPEPMQKMFMPWLKSDTASVTTQQEVAKATSSTKGFLSDQSNQERFLQWQLGWSIGKDHLLFGSGPGTTRSAFYQRINTLPQWDYNVAMDHPHNDTIEQFSQNGIVGVLVYLSIWISLIVLFIKKYRHVKPEIRPYALGLFIGLMLFWLFNQFNFTVVHTGMVYITIIALFIMLLDSVCYYKPESSADIDWKEGLFYAGNFAVIIIAIVTIYWTSRLQAGEKLAVQAVYASSKQNYVDAADNSQKATEVFPYDENFARLASANGMLNAVFSKSLTAGQKSSQAIKAREIADACVKLNPYIPEHVVNQGLVYYVLAEDSRDEARGANIMDKGIDMIKYNPKNYRSAIDGYLYHGSYEFTEARVANMVARAPFEIREQIKTEANRFYQNKKQNETITSPTATSSTSESVN